MYMNAAYLKNTLIAPRTPVDQADSERPLRVLCCGAYRIYNYPDLQTNRPNGRLDYQLLYFHSGQGHFYLNNDTKETIIHAGQMLLFRPGDKQVYHYYAEDKTEVYWVHFTGNQVEELLDKYNFSKSDKILQSGVYIEYKEIFLKMISELQLCKMCYEERLNLMLEEIFLMIRRYSNEKNMETGIQKEIEAAIRYFSENYNKNIVISDYVKEHFFSTSYFTRNFKQRTGFTPTQYIVNLRINNAQSMLGIYKYSINEISTLVGYSDPLYFSRIFKKHVGYSPKEYRKLLQNEFK